jgi:DNA primase
MALIKDSSVREVVAAADMVEVVSGRTSLRRAGSRYSGRCPFHEERTPSFSVNPVEKLYHCFGCGKGGDVITFVRETENLDFAGAVEWLAERFRVTLEYEESSPQIEEARKRRERLHAVLDQAAAFYERHLWETAAGAPVREYLERRGLGEAICREFRLGLSPGAGLAGKAQERGFTADELRAAGLTKARGSDYFPRRLMFPLADARGRIVGFQARKLHEDDPLKGKYVNSPESELFHKSAILYGLHLARTAIAKQERAVVVEGNTDVIALRQASFEPVVASMGTALTERQLKELQRLTRRIFLCFDSDAAGTEATLRGMELASTLGFDVRVVTLPKGEDPADAPQGFEERLGDAESYVVYRVRLELERAPDRQEAFVRAREVLARVDDSPERQDALRLLADKLDLPRETLAGLAPKRTTGVRTLTEDLSPKMLAKGDRLERDALAACLLNPGLQKLLAELSPEHFDSELHRRFRTMLIKGLVEGGEEDAELVTLRAELDARAAREGLDERTGKELLLNLRERRLRRELAHADLDRLKELQTALTRVQDAILELA